VGGIGLATQHLRPTARDMGVNDIVLYLFALLLRCDAMCLWLKVDLPDSATPPESAKADALHSTHSLRIGRMATCQPHQTALEVAQRPPLTAASRPDSKHKPGYCTHSTPSRQQGLPLEHLQDSNMTGDKPVCVQ
jgi:hypothetical protein